MTGLGIGLRIYAEVPGDVYLTFGASYFMGKPDKIKFRSASELLNALFDKDLSDKDKYDVEVVELVRRHLGQTSLHSRAGNNLAQALIDLANKRSEEFSK